MHAYHFTLWHLLKHFIMGLNLDVKTKKYADLFNNYNGFLLQPLSLSEDWEHSHFLQGETSNRHHMGCEGCKHMLGGMIRQTCSHTQQTWSSSFPLVFLKWILLYYAYCTYLHIIQLFIYQKAGITWVMQPNVLPLTLSSHQYDII